MANEMPLTRRGDREGRRRNILRAASEIVRELGVDALNMREIARRAGVSPGAAYFYYRTKEEIFVAVYAECVDDLAVAARADCEAAETLVDLFRMFAGTYLQFYRDYGRHLNVWALIEPSAVRELPPELVQRLRVRVIEIFTTIGARMRALADEEGMRLSDSPLAMPLLWMVIGGLAENYSGPRTEASLISWDDMVSFAAQTLLQGLKE